MPVPRRSHPQPAPRAPQPPPPPLRHNDDLRARYVIDDEAINNVTVRHYGVWDRDREDWAELGDEYGYGLTLDEARDLLRRLTAR
jgi:hypothetical protein